MMHVGDIMSTSGDFSTLGESMSRSGGGWEGVGRIS